MNKKGFTLIEILSTIILLSIIVFIAVPFFYNIIEDTKKESKRLSAENYVKSLENELIKKSTLTGKDFFGSYQVSNGLILHNTDKIELDLKGKIPDKGIICVNDSHVTNYSIKIDNYVISKLKSKEEITKNGEIEQLLCIFEKINISATPDEWSMNKEVTITGTAEGSKLQYQLGTTSGEWIDYTSTFIVNENTTVYARLYDGHIASSTVSLVISKIDVAKPTVDLNLNNNNSIHVILHDNEGISGYAITQNSDEINYIEVDSVKDLVFDTDVMIPGIYYVYVKDNSLKVTAKSILVPIENKDLTFVDTSRSNYTGGSNDGYYTFTQTLNSTKADLRGATSLEVSFYRYTTGGNTGSRVYGQYVGARLRDANDNILKESPQTTVNSAMTYSYVFTLYDIEPSKLINAYVELYNISGCYRSGLYMNSPTAKLSQDEPKLIFTPDSEYLSKGGSADDTSTLMPAIETTQSNLSDKTSVEVKFNLYTTGGHVGSSIRGVQGYLALYSSNGTLLKQTEAVNGEGDHTLTINLSGINKSDLYAAYAVVQASASCYRSGIGVKALEVNVK